MLSVKLVVLFLSYLLLLLLSMMIMVGTFVCPDTWGGEKKRIISSKKQIMQIFCCIAFHTVADISQLSWEGEDEVQLVYFFLRRLDVFRGVDDQTLRTICQSARYEQFQQAGKFLYKKGQRSFCWYILLSGAVFCDGRIYLPVESTNHRAHLRPVAKAVGSNEQQCILLYNICV
ncbi:hypothetical protein D917_04447 [Trichinella nativa]|uniref:Cyclic nucleotide-binding domain-containing protein n=1 Tax=Trichinella nativa TaxID=6335 RepID=A0A1Y3E4B6_9BILA|nr:hypothetical protein D917_04447 [Trichinella nativa]